MYNRQNLPLSPKKVFKKSLAPIFLMLLCSVVVFVFPLVFLSASLLLVFLITFIFDLIAIGLVVLYQYLYYKFYYYNFEDNKAEIKKGVVAVSTGHVQYNRIQNIYMDQDIMDRILGLYDVHYETAGESSGFYSHVDGLIEEDAEKLVAFLNEKVSNNGHSDSGNAHMQEDIAMPIEEMKVDDKRVFTRDNIPIDRSIVWLYVFRNALSYVFLIVIIFFQFLLTDSSISEGTSIIFIPGLIIPILMIGNYIYMKIWYNNFYFKFDGDGGMISEKVFSVKSTYLYYNRIQNIDVSQGFLARLLGLNELKIETAAEGTALDAIKISGLGKENADMLRDFLLEKSRAYHSV